MLFLNDGMDEKSSGVYKRMTEIKEEKRRLL